MGTMTREWRTVEVRIPPEDDRYPDGWWVNTRTGECVNGALPSPGSLPNTEGAAPDGELGRILAMLAAESSPP